MTTRALVLAGGGNAGIGWETGVLRGLLDSGLDVLDADLVVGTSAGASVGAQITSGVALTDLYEQRLAAGALASELPVPDDDGSRLAAIGAVLAGTGSMQEVCVRIGALALASRTVTEEARRAVIAARLPAHAWPERRLLVTAVDAASGELRCFDRSSGVSLVDAVAASCAVPGVWPPVTIDGRRYIDGGVRSIANVDLAEGCDRVLVLAPFPDLEVTAFGGGLRAQIAGLSPSRVHLVVPDAASRAAFGNNALDARAIAPSARAGREQGRGVVEEVREAWR